MADDESASDVIDLATAGGNGAARGLSHHLVPFINRAETLYQSGRYDEAALEYQVVLDLERHNQRARIGQNRAIRKSVPRWHWEMLHDAERAELYDKAIREAVRPDLLVLDIGTGSGLLSMMAARAGAREVVACEGQPWVAQVAEQIVGRAGYGDRVTVLPKLSSDIRIPQDLPRRADVLITEIVDCGLLGEGILPAIAHAREHLLTENALILPSRGRIVAQLVECESLYRKNNVGELYGFDLADFNQLSSLEYFDSRLRKHAYRTLSEPLEIFDFDFYRDVPGEHREEFVVTPTAVGDCHAVVFWFVLELAPGIELTNSPDHPGSHWKQAVQCLPTALAVNPGEPILLEARHDGTAAHFTVLNAREGAHE